MARQPDPLTTDAEASRPEDLRREIARTRAEMGSTVDAIEDRVSPSRIRARQAERLRSSLKGARVAVMGAPDHEEASLRERASERTEATRQAVEGAPERVRRSTRGNPLAAGLIAFGAGALTGTLLPATELEQRAAGPLRAHLEGPVRERLEESGHAVTEHLREDARRDTEEVTETARHQADRIQDQTRSRSRTARTDPGRGTARGPAT